MKFWKVLRMEEDKGGFMGGGGGDPVDPVDPVDPQEVQYSYPEGLDPSFHGNATLLKHANDKGEFNQAEIAKALIHATSAIGADKMLVPNDKFTDEQWKETFQKLGLPDTVDKYDFQPTLPEGFKVNEELMTGYKQKAHELGILPHQAKGIMEYYNEFNGKDVASQSEAYANTLAEQTASLKTEWGEAYDKNINIAEQALKHFYPDEAQRKAIVETGFLDTIEGTKFFNMLGTSLGEDTIDFKGAGTFGASPEELGNQISAVHGELTKMGQRHPQYQAKLKEYNNLLTKKHGSAVVGPTR
tara:strand:- start:365 stop:1264 length:900 start_codon:yes stop_codon:yes gene_type:complete